MAVDYLKQKAVNQIPDEQAQKIANEDGIQYSDIHVLELDFKGETLNAKMSPSRGKMLTFLVEVITFFAEIIKIESLWDFTSLVKLYLNNNLIEKIEGLEYLRNLKWLGETFTFILSFHMLLL